MDRDNLTNKAMEEMEKEMNRTYVLIEFPEVQEYMTEKWFRKECYLCQAFEDQEHIDSAYFIPVHRYNYVPK